MFPDIYYIGSLFFVNFIVGLVSWPVSALFFNKLNDKGYAVGHILGWISFSYIGFLLITLKLLPLTIVGTLVSLIIWIGINAFVLYKFKTIDIKKIDWHIIAITQIGFLLFALFLYWVRGHGSSIYQIERFMDYGFLKSLFNADSLPLYNFWLSDETLNYYYYGHFVGYNILTLAGVPSEPGFFILLMWIFGISCVSVFRFGYDFLLYLKKSKPLAVFSAFLSTFFVMFAGTFHVLTWVWDYIQQLFFDGPTATYWYADATRYIEGTITEMPLYGFLVADLHPHIWAIPIGILGVYVLYSIWRDNHQKFDYTNKYIYLTVFILAIAYMTNSWDVLTLGVLLVGALVLKYKKYILSSWRNASIALLILILMPISSLLISMPWGYYFEPPVAGVGFVGENLVNCEISTTCEKREDICPGKKCYEIADAKSPESSAITKYFGYKWTPSDPVQWLLYWGPFLTLFILYLIFFGRKIVKSLKEQKFTDKNLMPLYILLVSALFWILVEIFFMKDLLKGGDWYRANTVFKIANQTWIWMGMILGPVVAYIVSGLKIKKIDNFYTLLKAIATFMALMIVWAVVNTQFIYTYKTIKQSYTDREEFTGISQGLKWWEDAWPKDYDAYKYLTSIRNSLPEDDKVRNIVEAEGDSFTDHNFYSTFLGWPTVLGWYGHIWTWHGDNEFINPIKDQVRDIYMIDDVERTGKILDKYEIDYIIIGAIEKERYGEDLKKDKLINLGDVIYQNSEVTIVGYSERVKEENLKLSI